MHYISILSINLSFFESLYSRQRGTKCDVFQACLAVQGIRRAPSGKFVDPFWLETPS